MYVGKGAWETRRSDCQWGTEKSTLPLRIEERLGETSRTGRHHSYLGETRLKSRNDERERSY